MHVKNSSEYMIKVEFSLTIINETRPKISFGNDQKRKIFNNFQ
jgi:hypothetical protein